MSRPVVEPFRRPACPYCAGHRGITFDTVVGQPVRAVAAGVVEFAGSVARVRYVVVRHADGRRATYGGLLTLRVGRGRVVRAGDVVGAAGETLHLGLREASAAGGESADAAAGGATDSYLDPEPLLGTVRGVARLVPLDTTPARSGGRLRLECPAARVGGVPTPLR